MPMPRHLLIGNGGPVVHLLAPRKWESKPHAWAPWCGKGGGPWERDDGFAAELCKGCDKLYRDAAARFVERNRKQRRDSYRRHRDRELTYTKTYQSTFREARSLKRRLRRRQRRDAA